MVVMEQSSLRLIFKKVSCFCYYLGMYKNQYVTYFLTTELRSLSKAARSSLWLRSLRPSPAPHHLGCSSQTPLYCCHPLPRNQQVFPVGSSPTFSLTLKNLMLLPLQLWVHLSIVHANPADIQTAFHGNHIFTHTLTQLTFIEHQLSAVSGAHSWPHTFAHACSSLYIHTSPILQSLVHTPRPPQSSQFCSPATCLPYPQDP